MPVIILEIHSNMVKQISFPWPFKDPFAVSVPMDHIQCSSETGLDSEKKNA